MTPVLRERERSRFRVRVDVPETAVPVVS